jgi:DNA-binding CsgD family transcriptional regulator
MTPLPRPGRPPDKVPQKPLSARQAQCLRLAAQGLTSAAIASRVGISPRTVDEHLTGACRILGVRTRVQAVACMALRQRQGGEAPFFLP